MQIAEEKKRLRKAALAWRESLDALRKRTWDEQILEHLLNLPAVQHCEVLLTYVSMEREIDTCRLVEWAWAQGKTVGVPLCGKGGRMGFYPVGGWEELHPSAFGMLEPAGEGSEVLPNKKTVTIVPGLVFDAEGYRLGWGGGYYDRYLSRFGDCTTVGIAYEGLRRDSLPRDDFDMRVRLCVTESGLYENKMGG